MALSLDPMHNPIVRTYELFREPEVIPRDGANFLGVENLQLAIFGAQPMRELVSFLRTTASHALETCRLTLEGQPLINFASRFIPDSFEWSAIDELTRQGLLNENASIIFSEWRQRLQYAVDFYWPVESDLTSDWFGILDELSTCDNPKHRFALEMSLRKSDLLKEFALADIPGSTHDVSSMVWYSPKFMIQAFANFKEFLEYIAPIAKRPIILFFFETISVYSGDFLKILPIYGSVETRRLLEEEIGKQLSTLTIPLLSECAELRTRYVYESRPGVGDRFYLSPALFLRQRGQLSLYPMHPLFSEVPLRSLVIYSLLAWLAQRTESYGDTIKFYFPSALGKDELLALTFSSTDIRMDDTSLFSGEVDWQNTVMRLAYDITDSTGIKSLREIWSQALQSQFFTRAAITNLFTTLEATHVKFTELIHAPIEMSGRLPDLELRVFLNKKGVNGSEIDFEVNSAYRLGYFHKNAGSTPLAEYDPQTRLADLKELAGYQLTGLFESASPFPDVNRLDTRGRELWVKWIPDELKRDYLSFRNQKDLAIMIVSTDPSFPWELVKPSEIQGSNIAADGFKDLWWALQFSLARWLAGRRPPGNEIQFTRICCVATSHSQLSSADAELGYLRNLGRKIDEPKTRSELLKLLRTEDYDVIHFSCHGHFNEDQPNKSAIQLPDQTLLIPEDLYDTDIEERMDKKRPLVFLNACHSGRIGPTVTGLGGWAERFIDMGCGAFIGCGWEVADPLAAEFAILFYKYLRDGNPLGKAVQSAREQIHKTYPNNSTWLAYFLYGNPYAYSKV